MPSLISHSVVGVAAGTALLHRFPKRRFLALSMLCAVLPDADVAGFALGVRYGDFFGHRGFFHSLFFAFVLGALVASVFFRSEKPFTRHWFVLAGYFGLVTATHGILDAFTSGGLGVALLSPVAAGRYFFPWTPIEVSPLHLKAFFSPWGVRVLLSEFLWIWLPALAFAFTARAYRKTKRDGCP